MQHPHPAFFFMILVLSCSHHPESRSRLLAEAATKSLTAIGATLHFLDLRTLQLPLCDGHSSHAHPHVNEACKLVQSAEGILLSTPIYNYGAAAITKNFIELTGATWQGKPVGLLCAAGGKGSYMALLPLAGALMLDFHCYLLPRHVYATGDQFEGNCIIDPQLQERIELLAADIYWLSGALSERLAKSKSSF